MGARIMRAGDAPLYFPPLHEGVVAQRLQGLEAGPTEAFWVGRSHYPPGSSAQTSPTAAETVYVVLEGEFTLALEDQTHVLRAGDSAHMPKGTVRSMTNESGADAHLLVIIATPRDQ